MGWLFCIRAFTLYDMDGKMKVSLCKELGR